MGLMDHTVVHSLDVADRQVGRSVDHGKSPHAIVTFVAVLGVRGPRDSRSKGGQATQIAQI